MRIFPALIAAAALLAACSEVGTEPTTAPALTATSAELPPSTVTPEVQPLDTVLPAGRYCYAGDDGITKIYVRMTVLDSGEVFGDTRIGVANVEEAYFTSATQRFDGNLAADGTIVARLTTWVEYDIQESVESWSVLPSSLATHLGAAEESPCDVVREEFVDATLPGTDIGVTADELLDRTFRIDERVSFDAGASSATVSNAVTRGDADRYVFQARGGELMTVSINSLENNAVFDVVSDSGLVLSLEATSSEISLPHMGDFFVIVSGTSGNATYDLIVTIV